MTRRLLGFFALAYALSWAVWLPAVLAHLGWMAPMPTRILHVVGAMGPMLAAVLIGRSGGAAALARRCVPDRASLPWLAVALVIPAGIFLLSVAIVAVFYRAPITWGNFGRSDEFPEVWPPLFWVGNLVFYGFGEEVGWRGFALPLLQSRMSALWAALAVTLGWAGWHVPLFIFSEGLSRLGLGGTVGWFFSLALGSVVLTWLFNSSRGSIAVVAVFHAALDVFMMSPVAPELMNVMGAIITLGAVVLIPIFGRADLARRPRVTATEQPPARGNDLA